MQARFSPPLLLFLAIAIGLPGILTAQTPLFAQVDIQHTAHSFVVAEFSNDTLADILTVEAPADENRGAVKLLINKGNNLFEEALLEVPALAAVQLAVLDFDHNGLADVFMVGRNVDMSYSSYLLLNIAGTLKVEPLPTPSLEHPLFWWADLDGNGWEDLVLSSAAENKSHFLYNDSGALQEEANHPFIGSAISQLTLVPYAYKAADIYVISTTQTGAADGGLYSYQPGHQWQKQANVPALMEGTATIGDLNHDGNWDLYLSGTANNQPLNKIFYGEHDATFTEAPAPFSALANPKAVIADLNHDGLADLFTEGEENSQSKMYYYLSNARDASSFDQYSLDFPANGLFYLADLTGDRNLDLLISHDQQLQLYSSQLPEPNTSPKRINSMVILPLAEGYVMSWDKPVDDVTPTETLSFAYFLGTAENPQADYAALLNPDLNRRLVQALGNGGLKGTALLPGANFTTAYQAGVSALDNAWQTGHEAEENYAGLCQPGEICAIGVCTNLTAADTTVCPATTFALSQDFGFDAQLWYSYNTGFIGEGAGAKWVAQVNDKLYGIRTDGACISVFTIEIKVINGLGFSNTTLQACHLDTLLFTAKEGADSTGWISLQQQFTTYKPSLHYTLMAPDTLIRLSYMGECILRDSTFLTLLPAPELTTSGDVVIQYGRMASLDAWGGTYYAWTPAYGLSNPSIANPTASPDTTTTYTVTSWNENGCTAQASLTVTVNNDLFIPTLFSPNQDGQNERFVVLGSGISRLRLRVYDRDGQIVYEANSFEEASHHGWDGRLRGRELPAATYTWSLQGQFADGEVLQYQGKTTGHITLIR